MRRTQIQFDEATYQALKREAHQRGVSMSEVLRQLVRQHIAPERARRARRAHDLSFVSLGRSQQRPGDRVYPISEHHDEALEEDFAS